MSDDTNNGSYRLEHSMRRFVEDLRRRAVTSMEWSQSSDEVRAHQLVGAHDAYNEAAAQLESEINRVMKETT